MRRFASECEEAKLRVDTSKSSSVFSTGKRRITLYKAVRVLLLKARNFKYPGVLFQAGEGKIQHEMQGGEQMARWMQRQL